MSYAINGVNYQSHLYIFNKIKKKSWCSLLTNFLTRHSNYHSKLRFYTYLTLSGKLMEYSLFYQLRCFVDDNPMSEVIKIMVGFRFTIKTVLAIYIYSFSSIQKKAGNNLLDYLKVYFRARFFISFTHSSVKIFH